MFPSFFAPADDSPAAATERLIALCGWLLFAAVCVWAIFFVPMNMDEASPYHLLACQSHPISALHVFREGCFPGHYSIVTPFGFYMARSYPYLGMLSSFLYAPFYYLAPTSPSSLYWFGLGCFVLFAVTMSRFTAKPRLSLPLFLAFFPFLFQFVHDEGVSKFSLLLFPLAALLFRRMTAAEKPRQYALAFLLALLLLAGIENKIFVLHLLPAIGFFCLALLGEANWQGLSSRLRRALPAFVLIGALLVLAVFVLLFSSLEHDDMRELYLFWLRDFAKQRFGFWTLMQSYFFYTFFWAGYAHFIFIFDMFSVSVILGSLLTLGFFVYAFLTAHKAGLLKRLLKPRAALLLASFCSLAIVFLVSGNVWAGHHFVFFWVPLMMLVVDFMGALKPAKLLGAGFFFLFLNAFAALASTQQPIAVASAPERDAILQYLAEEVPPSRSLVNFSTWGGYYNYSLFAPRNQLVVFTEPLEPANAARLWLLRGDGPYDL